MRKKRKCNKEKSEYEHRKSRKNMRNVLCWVVTHPYLCTIGYSTVHKLGKGPEDLNTQTETWVILEFLKNALFIVFQAERINRRRNVGEKKKRNKRTEGRTSGASHPVSHGVRRKERHIE